MFTLIMFYELHSDVELVNRLLDLKCNVRSKCPGALNGIHPPIARHRDELGGVDKILDMICGTLTKSNLYKVTTSQQNIRSALLERDRAYII